MNGLRVPHQPSLRHEPLATELAMVTLGPEVLFWVYHSMHVIFTRYEMSNADGLALAICVLESSHSC